MRRMSLGVALATVAVVSPLSAQTWQAIGVPNNGNTGAYWNNGSDDRVAGSVCNVGAIMANTPALSPASCSNQGPVYIPLAPAPLTVANVFLGGVDGSNPGAFRFSAGTYNFGLIGRVAGDQSSSWGTIDDLGNVRTGVSLVAGGGTFTTPFAIWITQAVPAAGFGTVYSSDMTTGTGARNVRSVTTNQQFAVFTDGTGVGGGGGLMNVSGTVINASDVNATFYVGMEDNISGGRGFGGSLLPNTSDRDYNDILISIRAVPEPATVGLMGLGLLALAAVANRRKA